MKRLRDLDHEIAVALGWLVLAGIGWWRHSLPIAIIGLLGALTTVALYVWFRFCLTGVSYTRSLSQSRATFNERISLDVEILNDKLLPLAWFRAEDEVPAALRIEGGTIVEGGYNNVLVNLLPLLPYQRVRRHHTVVCTRRGEHTFGGVGLSSGDPVGLRSRSRALTERQRLLVYPKVFALAPAGIASRVLVGDDRSRFELIQDPSRVAGVREYRAGDPLKYVDWRATARSTTLLVRQFEPSVSLRVALFIDFRLGQLRGGPAAADALEFTIAVGASLLSDLALRKVAVGLYSSGSTDGSPIAFPPSTAPTALPTMLESLARASAFGLVRFPEVLSAESGKLQRGTSVVTVATDYTEPTMVAIAELRRRHPVTAIFVEGPHGSAPPAGLVDAVLRTRYEADWAEREVLELGS